MSLIRPSMNELREMIETARPDSPWEAIRRGDVLDQCDGYSELYSDIFTDAGIDHAVLEKYYHHLLAVNTRDQGVVLFDPTFCQFNDRFSGYYFLGTPKELCATIEQYGGLDSVIQPYEALIGDKVTYRQCFTGHDIALKTEALVGPDPQKRAECARPYVAALAHLHMHPKDMPWTNYVQARAERSSSEVSP